MFCLFYLVPTSAPLEEKDAVIDRVVMDKT